MKKEKQKKKNKNFEPDLQNGIEAIINSPCLNQQIPLACKRHI